ncbi:WH2 domain-containing protein [Spongorhabdus nitratireducens]
MRSVRKYSLFIIVMLFFFYHKVSAAGVLVSYVQQSVAGVGVLQPIGGGTLTFTSSFDDVLYKQIKKQMSVNGCKSLNIISCCFEEDEAFDYSEVMVIQVIGRSGQVIREEQITLEPPYTMLWIEKGCNYRVKATSLSQPARLLFAHIGMQPDSKKTQATPDESQASFTLIKPHSAPVTTQYHRAQIESIARSYSAEDIMSILGAVKVSFGEAEAQDVLLTSLLTSWLPLFPLLVRSKTLVTACPSPLTPDNHPGLDGVDNLLTSFDSMSVAGPKPSARIPHSSGTQFAVTQSELNSVRLNKAAVSTMQPEPTMSAQQFLQQQRKGLRSVVTSSEDPVSHTPLQSATTSGGKLSAVAKPVPPVKSATVSLAVKEKIVTTPKTSEWGKREVPLAERRMKSRVSASIPADPKHPSQTTPMGMVQQRSLLLSEIERFKEKRTLKHVEPTVRDPANWRTASESKEVASILMRRVAVEMSSSEDEAASDNDSDWSD